MTRTFRKSSHSGVGNCVEVALDATGVLVRDSKQAPGGTVLTLGAAAWRRFTANAKRGLFNLPA